MRLRTPMAIGLLAVAAAGAIFLRLLVGGSRYSAGVLAWADDPSILNLRLLAAAAAAIVGASLAVAGAQLQALLRNPLASPDLLGMSAGAGLALALTSWLGHATWAAPPIPATLGSLGTLAIVYTAAQRRAMIEPVSLVLVGVIVSVMLAAATLGVQSLMPREAAYSAARWMLGGIGGDLKWWQIGVSGAVLTAGIGVSLHRARLIDAAAFSDDEAHGLGVPLLRLRIELFAVSGVLTAGCVVLAGPIGFVGLVCPHVVRLMIGPTHQGLAIGSALAGAAMLVLADVFVQLIVVPTGRLPIGVLTALVGGPVFLMMLRGQWRGGR